LGPVAAAWAVAADEAEADEAEAAEEVEVAEAGVLAAAVVAGVLAADVLAALLLCAADEQAETATPRPTREVPNTSVIRVDRPRFMIAPARLTGTDTLGDSGPRYSVVPWR
jgi:hypothetical protein